MSSWSVNAIAWLSATRARVEHVRVEMFGDHHVDAVEGLHRRVGLGEGAAHHDGHVRVGQALELFDQTERERVAATDDVEPRGGGPAGHDRLARHCRATRRGDVVRFVRDRHGEDGIGCRVAAATPGEPENTCRSRGYRGGPPGRSGKRVYMGS